MSTDQWDETTEPDACSTCGAARFHRDAHSHICSNCGAYHGPALRPRYGYSETARTGARDAIERGLDAFGRCLFWLMAEPDPPYPGGADVRDAGANHRLALALLDNATHAPARCAPGHHWHSDSECCCICGHNHKAGL